MLHWFLTLDLFSGPAPWAVWALAALSAVALLIRPLRRRWIIRAVLGLVLGLALGYGIAFYCDTAKVFELGLPPGTILWTTLGGGLIGLAVVSLWASRWWRKIVAIVAIVASLLMMTVGINQAFGLTRTPGAILGINTLPAATSFAPPLANEPVGAEGARALSLSWRAPADLPKQGKVFALSGDNRIPSTAGFAPRDASIYLPPAALVKDPPALPVTVLMMGLPGAPNPSAVAAVLDEFAKKHDGLGPIVIVADQLGAQLQNPGCVDSAAFGGVETYLNKDVPTFIRSHLRVLQDPQYWTIAGYSNGGACAFMYGARYPQTWGNIATVSGEPWAGSADPASVLTKVYRGDKAAFDANKPAAILAQHPGAYAGHYAVFAAGALDHKYGALNKASAALAEAAGFQTTFFRVPNATHTGPALSGGLTEAFSVLYPRWGLAAG